MEKTEAQAILDSLYPVGQPRWFQVVIEDQQKAMKSLPWKENPELGFKVQAIACRDDIKPQVSGLVDLKDDIISQLIMMRTAYQHDVHSSFVINQLLNDIKGKFNEKIDEISSRTIKTVTQNIPNE